MPEEDVVFGVPGEDDPPAGDPPAGDDTITLESVYKGLPEELVNDPSLSPIKDIEGLVKGYVHAQKTIGKDKVALPGENATEEELTAFYNKLGRPEEASAYSIGQPEDLPEGFQYRQDQEEAFREVAHKAGLSQAQLKEVWGHLTGVAVEDFNSAVQNNNARIEKDQSDLKAEWGMAYTEKTKLANKALFNLVDEDGRKWLNESGALKEPKVLKIFAEIGSKLGEDKISSKETPGTNVLSTTEAKRQINEMLSDKNGPYWNKNDPRHDEAVEKMEELNKMAYPEEK